MSSRAPRVTGRELIAVLERSGFRVVRIRGSHHFLRHSDARATVDPLHAGEALGPGLLNKILRDTELTVEELKSLLG
jgi:predicted RNA binding protein YcfA (HicA-like mRNA interferase family)